MNLAAETTLELPSRRPELVIRPLGDEGQYVVKHPRTGDYFHLGAEEHFLLTQLDGQKEGAAVCAAFAERFGQPLSEEELGEFVEMARDQQLLLTPEHTQDANGEAPAAKPALPRDTGLSHAGERSRPRQSILYWRKSLFDPDRFCAWLEPKIRFFWTRGFLFFSAGLILLALALLWSNRRELAASFTSALRWETALWVWLTLFVVTMLHEFAHGLTCKHHGGEVHEIGVLLMFFLPCFYCNVSDAWLFKEKSKRLWVTFAGGYFELFLWALAVFVWRLTQPDSGIHYLAFVVLTACGVQTLFNFNPLIKLDGYYLLSDWLQTPNLHQRGQGRFKAGLRRLLWGAPRPEPEPADRKLFIYGMASWFYSLVFLGLMLGVVAHFAAGQWGWLGLVGVGLLGFVSLRGVFHGFSSGEVTIMILKRYKRTIIWLLVLGGLVGVMFIPVEDWAAGTFHLRSGTRVEIRAPVSGQLQMTYCDEGDRVTAGAVLLRLEVPDLESKLAQKQAEVLESKARLKLLEIGPRPEEVKEQRRRVARAKAWRDLSEEDLKRLSETLKEELAGMDKRIDQGKAELDAAHAAYERARELKSRRVIAEEDFSQAERRVLVARASLEECQAKKRASVARGTLEAESELARREKELADAEAALTLLEAGSRPEEIDAERARLRRLQEEARYLFEVQGKLTVHGSVSGIVTTARLREKVGQFFKEGDLICVIEDQHGLEVEIAVAEQDMTRVRPGLEVALKPRLLPEETFAVTVERIAANAVRADPQRGEAQSKICVYSSVAASGNLRPDMSGHARIYTGRRTLGGILLGRVVRLARTEFWW